MAKKQSSAFSVDDGLFDPPAKPPVEKVEKKDPVKKNEAEIVEIKKEEILIGEGATAPEGFYIIKEAKSRRVQSLIKPSVYEKAKALAEKKQVSMNEIINLALDTYVNLEEK